MRSHEEVVERLKAGNREYKAGRRRKMMRIAGIAAVVAVVGMSVALYYHYRKDHNDPSEINTQDDEGKGGSGLKLISHEKQGITLPSVETVYAEYPDEDKSIGESYFPNGYEGYCYPVLPRMSTWPYGNHQTMIDVCRIPDDLLGKMSTNALVQTVIAYPLFVDVLAYDSVRIGFEVIRNTCNGLAELSKREDAVKYIGENAWMRSMYPIAYSALSQYFDAEDD
jgi:hypothetical protein